MDADWAEEKAHDLMHNLSIDTMEVRAWFWDEGKAAIATALREAHAAGLREGIEASLNVVKPPFNHSALDIMESIRALLLRKDPTP
jgi:hypothetical protein